MQVVIVFHAHTHIHTHPHAHSLSHIHTLCPPPPRYDLLCEEDPEEFVAVEHPSTGIQTEDTPLPGSSEQTHRPGAVAGHVRCSGTFSYSKLLSYYDIYHIVLL